MAISKLILSVSLATLATFTHAAPAHAPPTHVDACGILGGLNATAITYKHVVDCYSAIPFDNNQANTTLSTMLTLFKDFYVFTDFALSPTATRPFSDDPVDIIAKMEKIGRTRYTSDYQFHTDIYNAVNSLRDAHTAYYIYCYLAYTFTQKLSLYAPVVDGKQARKTFGIIGLREYDDCTVNMINGQDALTYLKSYARDVIGRSHDPNVRLNSLLATLSFEKEKGIFTENLGDFTLRMTVPEAPYVDYQLQCSHLTQPVDLREEWDIIPQTKATFEDVNSYVTNICLTHTETAPASSQNNAQNKILIKPIPQIIKRAQPEPKTAAPGQQYSGAEQLLAGNATVFYHLKDRPDTGVVVCHTFHVGEEERDVMMEGLEAFNRLNVTNIIVDLQGNTGGYAGYAAFLPDILFPSTYHLPGSLTADLRVSKSIQQISAQGYNSSQSGFFDSSAFINMNNGSSVYQNNDLFDKPVTITRNGRTNLWTEKTQLHWTEAPANYFAAAVPFPWSDKIDNIRVLADGLCGSACAMSAYYFAHRYNVPTYSIGGTHGEDLSMFSFAGASVAELGKVQNWYGMSNMTCPMAEIPYKSMVTFSWLETYGEGRPTPLEYDAELYRPTYRLDYTPANAHSREAMWMDVAAASWK
ncbi:hypothetical protein EC957_000495 [Mortierella hygrophila]|uniref:Tail specific protease domain-containing protein n=1 Tax=Mortierella hygrophila TaxID=979708 RepID=A0A9P6F6N9_9FUNG|nr:hypothetical protein EC957_000495 [Mortierella hygrophila]